MTDNTTVLVLTIVVSALFGGGGVVAFLRARDDNKRGVRGDTRADTDSLSARAVAIVESQFTFLVKPLQDKVDGLETKVTHLQEEADKQRAKYWSAITYIRKLYGWIAYTHPNNVDFPQPPEDLADDI